MSRSVARSRRGSSPGLSRDDCNCLVLTRSTIVLATPPGIWQTMCLFKYFADLSYNLMTLLNDTTVSSSPLASSQHSVAGGLAYMKPGVPGWLGSGVRFWYQVNMETRACFLSLARSKLMLCPANHRAGYFSNLACVWAYSEQETENGPWTLITNITSYRL